MGAYVFYRSRDCQIIVLSSNGDMIRHIIGTNIITINEIIDTANVGRATFYAHFETKELLLQGLCEELFDHLFETEEGNPSAHSHVFDCDKNDCAFLHLLHHLKNDDNHLIRLLSCENNQPFFQYFRKGIAQMVKRNLSFFAVENASAISNFTSSGISSSASMSLL